MRVLRALRGFRRVGPMIRFEVEGKFALCIEARDADDAERLLRIAASAFLE